MVYQILLESPELYRGYYKNILVSFFSGHTVYILGRVFATWLLYVADIRGKAFV